MKLHQNSELFRQTVQFTAQQMRIPEIFIEKDYWVTFALYTIFKSEIGTEAVFKGGTSLLKCHRLINRFSEDIDLVVLRNENDSNNSLKNKITKISEVVSGALPEVALPEVTVKMGMNRKTAHSYDRQFKGDFGHVRDLIIVEATWLGYFEPYDEMQIGAFVYDMMVIRGQKKLAEEYGLVPFPAKVLSPTRTMCEKIMSLVRFSYVENPIQDLSLKIRHAYDLHQLLSTENLLHFFNSNDFALMLLKVGQDDAASYKSNNEWLKNHPNEALIFRDIDNIWKQLIPAYEVGFRAMVFGNDFPKSEEILQTLKNIKERLAKIEWKVSVPEISK